MSSCNIKLTKPNLLYNHSKSQVAHSFKLFQLQGQSNAQERVQYQTGKKPENSLFILS